MASGDITLFGHGPLAVSVLKKLLKENKKVKMINDSEGTEGVLSTYARDNDIPTVSIHPRKNEWELYNEIKKISGDQEILLSINYRFIIQNRIIELFKWPLNIHGSMLPKYRGRTPHVWAIINGEKETGITVHLIDEGVDTGPIVVQKPIKISASDTGANLLEKFEKEYPMLIIEALKFLEEGRTPIDQVCNNAFYMGRRTPEMGLIDFRLSIDQIKNFIRAQAPPYPGAYCYLPNGKKIILVDVDRVNFVIDKSIPKYVPFWHGDTVLVITNEGLIRLVYITQN